MKLYTIVYQMSKQDLVQFCDQYSEQQSDLVEAVVRGHQHGNQYPNVVKMLDTIKNKQYNKD